MHQNHLAGGTNQLVMIVEPSVQTSNTVEQAESAMEAVAPLTHSLPGPPEDVDEAGNRHLFLN